MLAAGISAKQLNGPMAASGSAVGATLSLTVMVWLEEEAFPQTSVAVQVLSIEYLFTTSTRGDNVRNSDGDSTRTIIRSSHGSDTGHRDCTRTSVTDWSRRTGDHRSDIVVDGDGLARRGSVSTNIRGGPSHKHPR